MISLKLAAVFAVFAVVIVVAILVGSIRIRQRQ